MKGTETKFNLEQDFLLSLGFSKEYNRFEKEIRLCPTHCIGCEYVILIRAELVAGYNTVKKWGDWKCYLYKPFRTDSDEGREQGMWSDFPKDCPENKIVICKINEEFIKSLIKCVHVIEMTMKALDLHQIGGMDFFNLYDSDMKSLYNDSESEMQRIYNSYVSSVQEKVDG